MDDPSATQLAEAARHGDRTAATRLIELFYERVYAFLRRHTGNGSQYGFHVLFDVLGNRFFSLKSKQAAVEGDAPANPAKQRDF
jgi:hypothetical protein